jgi:hypothetical protein
MRRFLVLGLAVVLVAVCVRIVVGQTKTVETQGVAAVVQGNMDISRDRALDDALRNAVEQATGSLIDNQTLVENYQLLSDKIYSQSRGYVESYQIVSEDVAQGLFRVTVQAKVSDTDLKNDLQALNVLMNQARKPRVMILFKESSASDVNSGRMAEGFISEVLLQRGFKLVDADTVRQTISHDKVLGLLAGDKKVASAVGAKYGAEILIIGNAEAVSQPITIGDLKTNSNQAVISVRLIRADTGEVKLSETRQAATPHLNKLTGLEIAVREASESVAKGLVTKIAQIFREQVYNITNVKLNIYGLKNYNDLQEVIKAISANIRGVKDIFQRNYSQGTAELEIELTGSTQSLARDLSTRNFGRYAFTVNEVTHNQLQVTVTSR